MDQISRLLNVLKLGPDHYAVEVLFQSWNDILWTLMDQIWQPIYF